MGKLLTKKFNLKNYINLNYIINSFWYTDRINIFFLFCKLSLTIYSYFFFEMNLREKSFYT